MRRCMQQLRRTALHSTVHLEQLGPISREAVVAQDVVDCPVRQQAVKHACNHVQVGDGLSPLRVVWQGVSVDDVAQR